MILFCVFIALLLLSWSGRSTIKCDLILLLIGLVLIGFIGGISIIFFIPFTIFIIYMVYKCTSDNDKDDKIQINSIKFKDDLY